jgi:hypothetical protein
MSAGEAGLVESNCRHRKVIGSTEQRHTMPSIGELSRNHAMKMAVFKTEVCDIRFWPNGWLGLGSIRISLAESVVTRRWYPRNQRQEAPSLRLEPGVCNSPARKSVHNYPICTLHLRQWLERASLAMCDKIPDYCTHPRTP